MRSAYRAEMRRDRCEQDKEREENLKEHTQTYVTEGCHNATP